MSRLSTGAVSRAVRGLTVEPAIALDKRRHMLGYDQLAEAESQFQLPIEGEAGPIVAWDERAVTFDYEFYNATEQRDSPFTVPHFSFGPVITSPTPVMICAVVREWRIDDREAVLGAKVAIGVVNPGGSQTIPFNGYVHLTFEGYGAPPENNADMDIIGDD